MMTTKRVLTTLLATSGLFLGAGGAAMAAPATSTAVVASVAPSDISTGHVNSNVAYTNVYDNYSGANAISRLFRCQNFQYTGYYNGRYHIYGGPFDNKWVSTSTTSPGPASSGVGCNP